MPKPDFIDSPEIGISVGENLPVVGVHPDEMNLAAGVLSRLSGRDWGIPFLPRLEEALDREECVLGSNAKGPIYEITATGSGEDGMVYSSYKYVLLSQRRDTGEYRLSSTYHVFPDSGRLGCRFIEGNIID